MITVKKRNGSIEQFDENKLYNAVLGCLERTSQADKGYVAQTATERVVEALQTYKEYESSVIMDMVRDALMDMKAYDAAQEFILYRNSHKPDIFRKRVEFKPSEYPQMQEYVDAIRHSYWIHTEFNYSSDIQDMKANMSASERQVAERAMLAISQIEVAVKTFWAKIGDKFPKPEIQVVGATFAESECFDDQTEILTESGWKCFDTLTYSDKVAQYDTNTAQINYVTPTNIVVKPYSGVLHHYKGKSTDICVTPKHELLVRHPSSTQYTKATSESGKWGRNYYFPVSGKSSTLGPTFTANDAFLIALQADGSLFGNCPTGSGRRDFTFTLSKERKVAALTRILTSLNVDFKQKVLESGKTRIWGVLPSTIPDVTTIKSFGWLNPSTCSYDYGRQFIAELGQWDSTVRDSNIAYYNSNVEAINKVQHLAVQSGYLANLSINRTKEASMQTLSPSNQPRLSAKDVYVLSLTDKTEKTYPHRTEVDYEGYVYCATVPTGAIVVRRNGASCVQGNCRHADAYSNLLEIMGLNEQFSQLKQVPAIQRRIDYLERAIATPVDDKDYFYNIILFSMLIENVSLFSQFFILLSMNKHKGYLKGIANAVQSTSLEEDIHAKFGFELVNIIKTERPDWWTPEAISKIKTLVDDAYQAEVAIVHWIFESYTESDIYNSYILPSDVWSFLSDRIARTFEAVGIEQNKYKRTNEFEWFDVEITATKEIDFFNKKSSAYNKRSKSITAGDLF